MRVMLVSHRFLPDDAGGVEQYTRSLATELVQRGDSVSIVARRSEHGRQEIRMIRERLPDGSPLYRMLAGGFNPEQFLDGQQQLDRLFAMAVMEAAPEIVHINHLMGFSPRLIRIAHRLGAAVVVSLHDFYFACPRVHLQKPAGELCQGPDMGRECVKSCFAGFRDRLQWGFRAMYFERALRMAERVIAYSQYVASYFQRMRGEASPISVIENGILQECGPLQETISAVEETQAAAAPGRTLTVAYCGTVVSHKGPHLILDALRIAALDRVRVLVIGQSPHEGYRARLFRKAAGVPGLKLQMYGRFSRRELPLLLRGVDCVVVPSVVPEAGPIVPREALGAGVPVVASRLGALPELIIEGENGFTFDPARPAELAAILRRLALDPELLPRLRAGARRSPVVTVAGHAERVRAVYDSAIEDFMNRTGDEPGAHEFDLLHEALLERERGHTPAPSLNAKDGALCVAACKTGVH
jgi:glycosyltransferase involved in cell wall biosynthesis